MFCNRTPSSLMLIKVVFFCHESNGVWRVLSWPYHVIIINIFIYSIGQVIFFSLILASIRFMDRSSFCLLEMFIILLGNWFLNYKWGGVIYNEQWFLKDHVFGSQFLTLIWTVIARGLLSTAGANRTSKVQNSNIIEKDVFEQNR